MTFQDYLNKTLVQKFYCFENDRIVEVVAVSGWDKIMLAEPIDPDDEQYFHYAISRFAEVTLSQDNFELDKKHLSITACLTNRRGEEEDMGVLHLTPYFG